MANFYIKEADWNKIQNYCKYAWDEHQSEIGGMMLAEKDKEGKWKLFKPSILKQTISAGNTVLEKEALSHYYIEVGKKYAKRNVQLVWWHSHHTMAAFWSGTDLTAIDEMSNGNMSISLVVNLKEEYKLRVNLWKPYPMHVDTELDIIRNKPKNKVPKGIVSEVDMLCEKPVYKMPKAAYKQTHDNTAWTYSNQGTLFPKQDQELTDLEAKVDDILTDYAWDRIKFYQYHDAIKALNEDLKKSDSELRVAFTSKDKLDTCIHTMPSDKWIYSKGSKFSLEDALIEADEELYNYGWYSQKLKEVF